MTKFQFKSSALNLKIENLEIEAARLYPNSRKNQLQYIYGNVIELSQQKLEKLCKMNIPKDHKEIAVQIRNEEVALIHEEFNQVIQDEKLVHKNSIGNLEWN
jgi:hypothetical protein